jgi:cytochrome P450
MSAGTDPRRDRATDPAVASLDLFDPGFRPDAPTVLAAREARWYARTPLGYAVLRYDEVATLLRDRRLRQGGGVHACLGAPLARAELAEALPILAARLREPELAGEIRWRPALGISGPVALPIRFRTAT